jgi:hypothetical protein
MFYYTSSKKPKDQKYISLTVPSTDPCTVLMQAHWVNVKYEEVCNCSTPYPASSWRTGPGGGRPCPGYSWGGATASPVSPPSVSLGPTSWAYFVNAVFLLLGPHIAKNTLKKAGKIKYNNKTNRWSIFLSEFHKRRIYFSYVFFTFFLIFLLPRVSLGIILSELYVHMVVRYHCGGWSEEVNSCISIISYMVYL